MNDRSVALLAFGFACLVAAGAIIVIVVLNS